MPRCLDCGNAETFFETNLEHNKVWYKEDGSVASSKFLAYTDGGYPRSCGECESENITTEQ
jgi:hypothetical protein